MWKRGRHFYCLNYKRARSLFRCRAVSQQSKHLTVAHGKSLVQILGDCPCQYLFGLRHAIVETLIELPRPAADRAVDHAAALEVRSKIRIDTVSIDTRRHKGNGALNVIRGNSRLSDSDQNIVQSSFLLVSG